jgi:hypothetical protein
MRVPLVKDEQPLASYVAAGLRTHGAMVSAETLLDKVSDETVTGAGYRITP